MEHTQQIKFLCVAWVSDLIMKVNQLGITTFILDIYPRQTEQMSVNTVHWESTWAILLHCHASVWPALWSCIYWQPSPSRFRLNVVPVESIKAARNLKPSALGWDEENSVLSLKLSCLMIWHLVVWNNHCSVSSTSLSLCHCEQDPALKVAIYETLVQSLNVFLKVCR